jgi:hypothetical protein
VPISTDAASASLDKGNPIGGNFLAIVRRSRPERGGPRTVQAVLVEPSKRCLSGYRPDSGHTGQDRPRVGQERCNLWKSRRRYVGQVLVLGASTCRPSGVTAHAVPPAVWPASVASARLLPSSHFQSRCARRRSDDAPMKESLGTLLWASSCRPMVTNRRPRSTTTSLGISATYPGHLVACPGEVTRARLAQLDDY